MMVQDDWPERRLILIQVDLSGHSVTLGRMNQRDAAQARARFADELTSGLKEFGFDLCFWAGDGGVFYREYNPPTAPIARLAIDAGSRAITTFDTFLQSEAKLAGLSLRVTGTLEPVVMKRGKTGYWYGVGFNKFLKYERELSKFGRFVITRELREQLPKETRNQRFEKVQTFLLPDGESKSVSIDSAYYKQPELTPGKRLDVWLKEHDGQFPKPKIPTGETGPKHTVIGDAVVVDAARTDAGYLSVDLNQVSFSQGDFENKLRSLGLWETWREKYSAHLNEQGIKAAVIRLAHPTSDDSRLLIDYAQVPYPISRSFNELIEDNANAQRSLVDSAFEFGTTNGRQIPGSLTTENIVILQGEKDASGAVVKHLLLAHRPYKSRGYFPNSWSASFEEQYCPAQWNDGQRWHARDASVIETVRRGVKEEFLLDQYEGTIRISLHAAFIQLHTLNIQILGVVGLPDCTFGTLKQMASQNAPEDHSEHDALAALPITTDVLWRSIKADGPGDLVADFFGPEKGGLAANIKTAPWHSTSRVRIACCLWLLEKGLI